MTPSPRNATVAFVAASAFAASAFPVRVYNRTRGPEKALAKLGATAGC
jgi:hypothetical protein